jgi:hypothetical protein
LENRINSVSQIALARLHADGKLDDKFGKPETPGFWIGGVGRTSHPQALELRPDGSFIVAGESDGNTLTLAFNAEGWLLPQKNPEWIGVPIDLGGEDTAYAAASHEYSYIEPRGFDLFARGVVPTTERMTVTAGTASEDFCVARFVDRNKLLDSGFGPGGQGYVVTNFGGTESAHLVEIQSNGMILAAGKTNSDVARSPIGTPTASGVTQVINNSNLYGSEKIALARYDQNGLLDLTFGQGGLLTLNFFASKQSPVHIGEIQKIEGNLIQVAAIAERFQTGPRYFVTAVLNQSGQVLRATADGDLDFTVSASAAASVEGSSRLYLGGSKNSGFALERRVLNQN